MREEQIIHTEMKGSHSGKAIQVSRAGTRVKDLRFCV